MKSTLFGGSICFLLFGLCIPRFASGADGIEVISKPAIPSEFVLGDSGDLSFSADGHYAVFISGADNLTAGSKNWPVLDIFLRDLQGHSNTLVSISADGTGPGDGDSLAPVISPDGHLILFTSEASNLVNGDENAASDAFVRDWAAGKTELISVSSDGTKGNGDSVSETFTPDGRYVLFESMASNLAANDSNGAVDLFLRDRAQGKTYLLTQTFNGVASSAGGPTDFDQFQAGISDDGRWVVFQSGATDLIQIKGVVQNAFSQVYLYDTQLKTNIMVSLGTDGKPGSVDSGGPLISGNGKYVAFASTAQNLAGHQSSTIPALYLYDVQAKTFTVVKASVTPTDTGVSEAVFSKDGSRLAYTFNDEVYLYDTAAGTTTLISANAEGDPVDGDCGNLSISNDGKRLVFISSATDLTDPAAFTTEVYAANLDTGEITLLSWNAAGDAGSANDIYYAQISADGSLAGFEAGDGDTVSGDENSSIDLFAVPTDGSSSPVLITVPDKDSVSTSANGLSSAGQNAVSSTGRYVVFTSYARDIVPPDTNEEGDVFVRDRVLNQTMLVSVADAGLPAAAGESSQPAMTPDGRFVVFTSMAALTAKDTNNFQDIYLRDLQTGTTTLVSVNSAGNGSGNKASTLPQISDDGRYVTFQSAANNLTPNDTDNADDIFLRDVQAGTTALISPTSGQHWLSPDAHYIYVATRTSPNLLYDRVQNQPIPVGPAGWSLFSGFSSNDKVVVQERSTGTSADLHLFDPAIGSDLLIATNSYYSHISPDANFVFYQQVSVANGVTRFNWNIFDVAAGTNTTILITARSGSNPMAWSGNERFLAFAIKGTNIITGDENPFSDIFLYDRIHATLQLVSRSPSGAPALLSSDNPSLNGDGSVLVFDSGANNLLADDLNNTIDVFAYQQSFESPPISLAAALNAQGKIALTGQSAAGKQYQLQSSASLQGDWLPVGNPLSSETSLSVEIDPALKPFQFYRIVILP